MHIGDNQENLLRVLVLGLGLPKPSYLESAGGSTLFLGLGNWASGFGA